MADVKWIKITTDIFDDDKILLIESLPEADSIIVIWFKLLCLAGKQNNSGVFVMDNRIPYTDKMLATIFRRKESTVRLALETFEQFGMVEIIDGVITIPRWGKHQNLEQLEERKKYQREYQKEYRKRQKELASAKDENRKCLREHLREHNVNTLDKIREDKKENREDKKENREDKNNNSVVFSFFESEFEPLSPIKTDEITKMVNEYGEGMTLDAMNIAVDSKHKNLAYVCGILRNWEKKKKTTGNRSFRGDQVVDDFSDIYEAGGEM